MVVYDHISSVLTQVMIYDPSLYNRILAKKDNTFKGMYFYANDQLLTPCGSTKRAEYPNVFSADIECDSFTTEHEIGHLYGLNHERQSYQNLEYRKVDQSAFAALCANSGTIMSTIIDSTIPIYSSPNFVFYLFYFA